MTKVWRFRTLLLASVLVLGSLASVAPAIAGATTSSSPVLPAGLQDLDYFDAVGTDSWGDPDDLTDGNKNKQEPPLPDTKRVVRESTDKACSVLKVFLECFIRMGFVLR